MKPSFSSPTAGFVVLCDDQGTVTRVVHDSLNLTPKLMEGKSFAQSLSGPNDGEPHQVNLAAERFVQHLISAGHAFGWEIAVDHPGGSCILSCSAGPTTAGYVVVAQMLPPEQTSLVTELMRINNETLNSLRSVMKQASVKTQMQTERDNQLLTGLTQDNNDVLTAQRELAKANAKLTQTNTALKESEAALKLKRDELEEANQRLDALATTDGLTGAQNRRSLEAKIHEEVSRSKRTNLPLSALMMDVDKFKSYNDTYGHQLGDDVLKLVATCLQETVRHTDFVARYGGEEFTILLPDTDAAGALTIAERLRSNLELASWPERPVTASFGVSTAIAPDITGTALIQNADRALYASKERGRNKVTHFKDL